MVKKIQSFFVYGLLVVIPVISTFFILSTLVNLLNYPIDTFFNFTISPYASFIITVLAITFLGMLTSNFIGRFFVKWFDTFVNKLPIIGQIYKSSKQIVNAFSLQGKKDFKPVLIEYPRKGLSALGFLTSSKVSGLTSLDGRNIGENKVSIFIPTTPNPTSGFFVFVDRADVVDLDMSMEDAVKLLMSAGVVNSDQ